MSRRVIVLGAGGHGQVVADILWQMRATGQDVMPVGYLDDNPKLIDQRFQDLPVLGIVADLATVPHDAVVVAVGDNATRRRLYDQMATQGKCLQICCHPRAVVATGVTIEPGAMICAGVVINPGSSIGANVILNTGCTVDHHNQIGDHAHIAPGVHLGGDVRIGAGTLIGIGATVIPQRSVGAWSVVGAGSVVTKNIPNGVVAAGMPARVIRKLDQGGSP
jgi:sugar O-acyltransferase (sialic acid O-acetyltransferase NeuD family)